MAIDAIQPILEPHTQQFVDGLADAPPIYTLSPDEARSVLVRAQSIPVGKPSAQIEDSPFRSAPPDRCRCGLSARRSPRICCRR